MEQLDEIKLESDTLIHIGGMPFEVKAGTTIYGRESNLKLTQGEGMGIGIGVGSGDCSNGGGSSCLGAVGA